MQNWADIHLLLFTYFVMLCDIVECAGLQTNKTKIISITSPTVSTQLNNFWRLGLTILLI